MKEDEVQMRKDAKENSRISLNRTNLNEAIDRMMNLGNIDEIGAAIDHIISGVKGQDDGLKLSSRDNADSLLYGRDAFLNQLLQIKNSRTPERAYYYLKRLKKSINAERSTYFSDINLLRWKEYSDIITDSLWILDRRNSDPQNLAWYWGNFVPQIPKQLLLRYTKSNEWVLDPFCGSGTTIVEAKKIGRNSLGIELNGSVAEKAAEFASRAGGNSKAIIVQGDSAKLDIKNAMERYGIETFSFMILHPPYHDIIKFSDDKEDLSNARTVNEFLAMLENVIDNVVPYLQKKRFIAMVIGDKYAGGEWIPLGFMSMNLMLKRRFRLKSIIVKNFDYTKAKQKNSELWRYRALAGGFYIFKHEYIMIFQKL